MQSKNIFTDKQICIVGAGGLGLKIYSTLEDIFHKEGLDIRDRVIFSDLDSYPNRKVRIWEDIYEIILSNYIDSWLYNERSSYAA